MQKIQNRAVRIVTNSPSAAPLIQNLGWPTISNLIRKEATSLIIYINDLPCGIQSSSVSTYADDSSLSLKFKNLTQLNEAMNDDLKSLESCLKGNKISPTVAKTHFILICSESNQRSLQNSDETLYITIPEDSLEAVDKTKYLGVQIDQNLHWKGHIKYISSKVSRDIGLLKHVKSFVPWTSLL